MHHVELTINLSFDCHLALLLDSSLDTSPISLSQHVRVGLHLVHSCHSVRTKRVNIHNPSNPTRDWLLLRFLVNYRLLHHQIVLKASSLLVFTFFLSLLFLDFHLLIHVHFPSLFLILSPPLVSFTSMTSSHHHVTLD